MFVCKKYLMFVLFKIFFLFEAEALSKLTGAQTCVIVIDKKTNKLKTFFSDKEIKKSLESGITQAIDTQRQQNDS